MIWHVKEVESASFWEEAPFFLLLVAGNLVEMALIPKQHVSKPLLVKKKKRSKDTQRQRKMTIKTLKFGGCSKSVAKREVYSITGLSKNQVDSQIKKKSNTLPKKKKNI